MTPAYAAGNPQSRQPSPGETCSCGLPAVVVFETARFGDVPVQVVSEPFRGGQGLTKTWEPVAA